MLQYVYVCVTNFLMFDSPYIRASNEVWYEHVTIELILIHTYVYDYDMLHSTIEFSGLARCAVECFGIICCNHDVAVVWLQPMFDDQNYPRGYYGTH